MLQIHIVFVEEQSTLNLLHFRLVSWVHNASKLELEVGHDLLDVLVVRIDLLELSPELWLLSSCWQPVDGDQVALNLEDLEL